MLLKWKNITILQHGVENLRYDNPRKALTRSQCFHPFLRRVWQHLKKIFKENPRFSQILFVLYPRSLLLLFTKNLDKFLNNILNHAKIKFLKF